MLDSPAPHPLPTLSELIQTGALPEVLPGVFGCRIPREPDTHRPSRNRRPGLFHLFALPHKGDPAAGTLRSLCHQLTIAPQTRLEVVEAGSPAADLIGSLDEVCVHLRHHGRHLLGE